MIVAGIDIGNTTTEIVLSEVRATHGPAAGDVIPLIARRAFSAGLKGSRESVAAAARLLHAAEAALDRRAELLLLPPLHPVLTLSATLPPPPAAPVPVRRVDGASGGSRPATPAGSGFAVGPNVPLSELGSGGLPDGPFIVSVPAGVDFEDAAARIAAAQAAGLRVAGAVAAGDDAVLIGNRMERPVPIVDEVDVSALPRGELIALEVAAEGARLRTLSDPVALVAAFGLEPSQAGLLAGVALELGDARAAALVQAPPAAQDAESEGGWLEVEDEPRGERRRLPLSQALTREIANVRPGSVRRLRAPAASALEQAIEGLAGDVRDVFAVDLPAVRRRAFARSGAVDLREVPLSALVEPAAPDVPPDAVLAELTGRPVVVSASEAEAAALGALTTPGAAADAAVCDLGGGTIDLVWQGQRLTAAGAGELLTLSVARSLGLQRRLAEYVKRSVSFRAEAPGVVHYEDGSRGFLDRHLPTAAMGRLCYAGRSGPVAFSDTLAPEEWRALRLAVKQEVIGANVDRCLHWLAGRPSTLLLCGGAALDAEAARIVGESLRASGTTVGTANVGGAYGPRFGVALGLVLACRRVE